MTATLHYLYDPLCGWCYGAAPGLRALATAAGLPPLTLHPTGLFAGRGARPMDRAFAAYAWSNDQRIAKLTGQIFSDAYRDGALARFDRPFDSTPATRALTAVHRLAPTREAEALEAIQHARFVDGRDITDPAVLSETLAGLGLAEAAAAGVDDEALDRRLAEGRALMAETRANGVPTLVLRTADGATALPSDGLYRDTDRLIAALRQAASA
ncbi:putative protein-disulfide isomerase [Azospirillum agricola]|uniref:DsbA family protein n=1 Tax=Azospirillum agricola TaxID=1720247 RepID=UPI001AE884E5|nr:DsbA family protein [Azospirillum agricola]MBP2229024.1 putative protein-disulfide isomerase [Azospirillum agricola]